MIAAILKQVAQYLPPQNGQEMDANEFRRAGRQMIDFVADYLENIRSRPVLPAVEPGYLARVLPEDPPEQGEPWDRIFPDIERYIMPGVSISYLRPEALCDF